MQLSDQFFLRKDFTPFILLYIISSTLMTISVSKAPSNGPVQLSQRCRLLWRRLFLDLRRPRCFNRGTPIFCWQRDTTVIWAALRAARVKITINDIFNLPVYCVIFVVHIQFTHVTTGHGL